VYILCRPLSEEFAPFMANRDAVSLMFAQRTSEELWLPFVDDANGSSAEKGRTFDLDQESMLLLIAKDKETMVRGLAFADQTKIACGHGSVVMFRGKFDTGSVHRDPNKKTTVAEVLQGGGLHFLSAFTANVATGGWRNPNKYVSTKLVRHAAKRKALQRRGYYVCLARQSSLIANTGGVTWIGRRTVACKTISTILNNDREVQVEGNFNLAGSTGLYHKLIATIHSKRHEKKAKKYVEELYNQQSGSL